MNELGNTPADKNYKPSGISKAEEAALKAYPDSTRDGLGILTFLGYTQRYRDCFIKGYEQAEKDLALTWEDIALIDDLLSEVPSMNKEEYYIEVLKRYLEAKK